MLNSMTLLGWFTGLVLGTLGVATVALGTGYHPWATPQGLPHPIALPLVHSADLSTPTPLPPALIHGQVEVNGRPVQHGLLLMQLPNGPLIPVPVQGGHFHLVAPPVPVQIKVRCEETGKETPLVNEILSAGPQFLRLSWEDEQRS
ncbi:MAG: hypothetical protein SNJ82_10475 [Gemmataceae bacterium]